jgi:hypothetical protein
LGIRPVGYGLRNHPWALESRSPSPSRQAMAAYSHRSLRDGFIAPPFQALRARLPSVTPYGTIESFSQNYKHVNAYVAKEAWAMICSPPRRVELESITQPHHAHCGMSFIFPAVCTMVPRSRSSGKLAALEKLHTNSNGTESACMAAPNDRKHRLINSHRPNVARSFRTSRSPRSTTRSRFVPTE